jgi:hypothetical protein
LTVQRRLAISVIAASLEIQSDTRQILPGKYTLSEITSHTQSGAWNALFSSRSKSCGESVGLEPVDEDASRNTYAENAVEYQVWKRGLWEVKKAAETVSHHRGTRFGFEESAVHSQ